MKPLAVVPRRPPALTVMVELEELPIVRLVCDTYEDEQRLRAWLARAEVVRLLPALVADALDGLDAREAA